MNTKKRIRKLERKVEWLEYVIFEKDPIKLAMIYSARHIQEALEKQIFTGDGKT